MQITKLGKHGHPLPELGVDAIHSHLIKKRTEFLSELESLSFYHDLPTKQLPIFFHSPFLLPDMKKAVDILQN
ncbi:MAG: hypothetical protein JJT78_00390, partial [Leptospira sp.]|nr:hypothetical protein [Leptospira sp.]